MYAEDNNGKLPNCFDWVHGGLDYSAGNPANTNIAYLLNGMLGPYVTNPAVYKCPADQSQAIEDYGVKLPRVRSYSMSQSFCDPNEGHLEDGDSPPHFWRHYTNTTDMVAPAPVKLWVLLDENPDSLNDGAFSVNMAGGNMYGGSPDPIKTNGSLDPALYMMAVAALLSLTATTSSRSGLTRARLR
jgi:hypothetical protein